MQFTTADVVRLEPRGPVLIDPRVTPSDHLRVVPPKGLFEVVDSPVDLRWTGDFDRGEFTLLAPVHYVLRDARVDWELRRVTVPAWYTFDGATLGRGGLAACAVLDIDPDAFIPAALLHDYLRDLAEGVPYVLSEADAALVGYRTAVGADHLRLQSDECFRAVLERTSGLDKDRVWLAYRAVQGHSLTRSWWFQALARRAKPLALAALKTLL